MSLFQFLTSELFLNVLSVHFFNLEYIFMSIASKLRKGFDMCCFHVRKGHCYLVVPYIRGNMLIANEHCVVTKFPGVKQNFKKNHRYKRDKGITFPSQKSKTVCSLNKLLILCWITESSIHLTCMIKGRPNHPCLIHYLA